MDAIEVVKAGLSAVESGQTNKFVSLLADDMVFAGPVPMPVGKKEFVGLQTALVMAMPDWKFNATNFRMEGSGDKVVVSIRITGTQTGELSLPMPGFPKFPPSGKRVSLPAQDTTFTVWNGMIARIEAEADPNNGVPGILSQLGIPMPPM